MTAAARVVLDWADAHGLSDFSLEVGANAGVGFVRATLAEAEAVRAVVPWDAVQGAASNLGFENHPDGKLSAVTGYAFGGALVSVISRERVAE